MKEFNDKAFKKFFTFLMTLAILLLFILSANLLLNVPINSKKLWIGSILILLSINLIADIEGVKKKLVVLAISSITVGTFLNSSLNWTLGASLLIGTITLILGALLYMTFIN